MNFHQGTPEFLTMVLTVPPFSPRNPRTPLGPCGPMIDSPFWPLEPGNPGGPEAPRGPTMESSFLDTCNKKAKKRFMVQNCDHCCICRINITWDWTGYVSLLD